MFVKSFTLIASILFFFCLEANGMKKSDGSHEAFSALFLDEDIQTTSSSRTKIILFGVNHHDPSQYIVQLNLLKKLINNGVFVVLANEGDARDLKSDIAIIHKNAVSFTELNQIRKKLVPFLTILNGTRSKLLTPEMIHQMQEAIKHAGPFQSQSGKNIHSNPTHYIKTLTELVNAREYFEMPGTPYERAKFELFQFVIKNAIPMIPMETKKTEGFTLQPIVSDIPSDPQNQQVLDMVTLTEESRTDEMVETLTKEYLSRKDTNTIIMTYNLGLLHLKRVAAKLIKKGVPIEDISVNSIETPALELKTQFPNMTAALTSGLPIDRKIRGFFDQVSVNSIHNICRLNDKNYDIELISSEGMDKVEHFVANTIPVLDMIISAENLTNYKNFLKSLGANLTQDRFTIRADYLDSQAREHLKLKKVRVKFDSLEEQQTKISAILDLNPGMFGFISGGNKADTLLMYYDIESSASIHPILKQ